MPGDRLDMGDDVVDVGKRNLRDLRDLRETVDSVNDSMDDDVVDDDDDLARRVCFALDLGRVGFGVDNARSCSCCFRSSAASSSLRYALYP